MGRPKKDSTEIVVQSDYLSASFILDKVVNIVPASVALNIPLGGGIPEGSVVLLNGLEKLGKTSLALKIGANGQNLFDKTLVYVNIEDRLKKMNLTGTKGLDLSPEKFKLITSQKGDILSAEQILERAEKALNEFPGCIMIMDSLSALSSAEQNTQDYGAGYGMEARKLEAEFFRRVKSVVSVNNAIIIAISHVAHGIKNSGMTEKVSQYTKFAQDIKLRISKPYKEPKFEWMSGTKQIGHRVIWTVLNSALGPPGGTCVGVIRYGIGIDDIAEMVDLACELNIIEKGGAWYQVPGSDKKLNGFDQVYEFLSQDEESYYLIEQKVREIIN